MTGSPLVFAHRGAPERFAEHTAEAYQLAIEQGADGLECDVRLTRDGHLVCVHDPTVRRTSDGQARVSSATLAQLRRLDFGHPGGPPARVLTLAELLEIAAGAGRPLRLLVETKHPSRYGARVEERLVELLRRQKTSTVDVTVMSFSPLALKVLRSLAPELDRVYLFDLAPPRVRDGRPPYGAALLGPGIGALRTRPELVERAHDRGHGVYVWTVNAPEDVDFAVGLGVDGLISDRPAFVLSRLGRSA